mmetsp:Transcript_28635/g.64599  ORF Transcript_28635/g.64599 Transcript_28635/m.64599 type:complete len:182 (+) Transcript_28635:291-836(+)
MSRAWTESMNLFSSGSTCVQELHPLADDFHLRREGGLSTLFSPVVAGAAAEVEGCSFLISVFTANKPVRSTAFDPCSRFRAAAPLYIQPLPFLQENYQEGDERSDERAPWLCKLHSFGRRKDYARAGDFDQQLSYTRASSRAVDRRRSSTRRLSDHDRFAIESGLAQLAPTKQDPRQPVLR